MKRNWTVALPIVVFLILLSMLSGYCIGINNRFGALSRLLVGKENLTGIWQANRFMASGWSDRYHFYSNGTFHFYPNEMICRDKVDEVLGSWSTEAGDIILTLASRISVLKTCGPKGFGTEVKRYKFELYQPETMTLRYVSLGTLQDDPYPSILLDGQQYWKFSDDPTRYGDEQFPPE